MHFSSLQEISSYSLLIILIYLITISAVFVVRFLNSRIGNFLAFISASSAFLMAAIRPSHFPDVDSYETIFLFASSGEFGNPFYWFIHGEPGFKLLIYLLFSTGLDYFGFLVFMSTLSLFLLFYISRIASLPFAYLWFTYLSFFFITRDLGVLRLAIASHLLVIFFIHRKYLVQIISISIATVTFQYFAIIAVLAKPFSRIKIDLFSISILFILSLFFSSFINFDIPIIPDLQRDLYDGTIQSEPGGLNILFPILRNLFFAFLIYFLMRNQIHLKHYRLLIWLALLSAATYVMTSGILVVAQRFSAYFGVAVPLALAFLLQKRSIKNHQFFIVVIASLLNFVSLFYFNEWIWRQI